MDTSNKESTDQLISDVLKEYGKVDILVNNAGVFKEWGAPFVQTNEDAVSQISFGSISNHIHKVYSTFEINTMGPLRLAKGFLPKMVEQNYGRIVNMVSQLNQICGSIRNQLTLNLVKWSWSIIRHERQAPCLQNL